MSDYKCSYGKNCECKTDEEKSTCDLAFETKTKMSKEESLCKKYNLTLSEVDEFRRDPNIREVVAEIMESEGLEFNEIQSPENIKRITEIWFEVIKNGKESDITDQGIQYCQTCKKETWHTPKLGLVFNGKRLCQTCRTSNYFEKK